MSITETLEYTQQAKDIADKLTLLGNKMIHDRVTQTSYDYSNPAHRHLTSMKYQLMDMQECLDEVLYQLEWQQYVWGEIKALGAATLLVVAASILVFFFTH